MKKTKLINKKTAKNKGPKKEDKIIKIVAEKNMEPVLVDWVSEVFGANPTKEEYESALSFVEDIIKESKKEPSYLKLLGGMVLSIERSKFIGKLLTYIFKTIVPSDSKSEIYNREGLEFDHRLILEELNDTAEELRRLKEKTKK